MTLPLPVRNRLAELILDAFREGNARAVLETLLRYCEGHVLMSDALPAGFPVEFFTPWQDRLALKGAYRPFHDEIGERVGRAWTVVKDRPLSDHEPSLRQVLSEAAALFDARLAFEVHELLEPFWMRAEGQVKETLQGLIQVAVGYHHLANDNVSGAQMLLEEGSARLLGQRLEDLDLHTFAVAVRQSLETVNQLGAEASLKFDWSRTPKFPRAH